MKEKITVVMSEIGPDLLELPHVVPALVELFAGDGQQTLTQREQLFEHLIICHYCRTAAMVLLGVAQEYDRRNNDPIEVTQDLLERFAAIDRKIEAEAHWYERLAVYAEAIAAKGRDKAAELFPDLAAHLSTCFDCRSIVEETVAFLSEIKDTG